MEWISGNLPLILCALAGFGLLVTEAFMPGFGIAGISGIILEIIAVYLAWVNHGTVFALVFALLIIAVIGLTVFISYRSALNGRLSKSDLILRDEQKPEAQGEKKALSAWIGKRGETVSALRPGGTVNIGGQQVNAASAGDFIERGTKVEVTGVQGDHVMVRAV